MALCLVLFLLTAGVLCLCPPVMSGEEHSLMARATITRQSVSFSCPMQLPSPFDSHMIPFAGTIVPQDSVPFFLFVAVVLIVSAIIFHERYRFYIQQLVSSYGSFKQFSYWAELFAKGILHSKIFA